MTVSAPADGACVPQLLSATVRVVKTTRQTSETQLSYLDSVRLVVAAHPPSVASSTA